MISSREIQIGNLVQIKVLAENREWGYNPTPDGEVVKVQGFGEICWHRYNGWRDEPGIYENRHWLNVLRDNGQTLDISICHVDKVEGETYSVASDEKKRLADLPETEFWETDLVEVEFNGNLQLMRVYHINYEWTPGGWDHTYSFSHPDGAGSVCYGKRAQFKLIERGDVWKFYHGEKVEFSSLEEEARFFKRLGKTEEIPNPKTGLYVWTIEDGLEALKSGLVHAIAASNSFLGVTTHLTAERFDDEELGARVARYTLENFKDLT